MGQQEIEEWELVKLAYETVTLTFPKVEILLLWSLSGLNEIFLSNYQRSKVKIFTTLPNNITRQWGVRNSMNTNPKFLSLIG